MKKEQGFTLIELLIVVAIIAIIAAIAVPNLLDARRAANESSAQASLRAIGSAQTSWAVNNPAYAPLSDLVSTGAVDARFGGGGLINGYELNSVGTAGLGVTAGTTATLAPFNWINTSGAAGADGYYAAVANAGSGRYGYAMGTDFVIRFAPNSTPNTDSLGTSCPPAISPCATHPVGGMVATGGGGGS